MTSWKQFHFRPSLDIRQGSKHLSLVVPNTSYNTDHVQSKIICHVNKSLFVYSSTRFWDLVLLSLKIFRPLFLLQKIPRGAKICIPWFDRPCTYYDAILPLRVLLLRKHNPKVYRWAQYLSDLILLESLTALIQLFSLGNAEQIKYIEGSVQVL